MRIVTSWGLAALVLGIATVSLGDDVEDGKAIFRMECYKTCHFFNNPYAYQWDRFQRALDTIVHGAPQSPAGIVKVKAAILGPDLKGVYNAPAGRRLAEGFNHSPPFREAMADIVWTEDMLDKWLTDSYAVIPGTWMAIKFPDPEVRRKIIAFLKVYE